MNQKINDTVFFIILVLLISSQALATDVNRDSVESQCSEEHSRMLTEGLSKRNAGDELCDATIMVGDKSFRVHKVVMSIFSPYFETRFTSEMQGGMERRDEVTLNSDNIDAEAFEMLKDYMYTSRITIDDSTAQRLLAGASYLQMTNVKAHCCAYMKKEVNAENCIGIKYIADKYSCSELSNYASDFTLEAFEDVAKGEEFLRATENQVIDIISDDDLATSEDKVHEAVMRWIRYRDESDDDRSIYLPTLMQHVRFPQMHLTYLVEVSKDPLIKACGQCQNYVNEAYYYMLSHHLDNKRDDGEPYIETRFKARRTNYLFAVGGYMGRSTASVERYDPRTNKWTEVTSMKSSRAFVGVAVNNGLYAVGGTSDSAYLSSIECYNLHTDKWTDNLKLLEPGRTTANSVATLNGFLYVIGGVDLSRNLSCSQSVMKYDPNINEWIECRPLRHKRHGFAVGVLNGYIYVVGGYIDEVEDTVERYDPTQNEWYNAPPMIAKKAHLATAAHGHYLYAVGGTNAEPLKSAERYDHREKKWDSISSMTENRYGHGLAVVNGLIYAVGGCNSNYNEILDTVEVYDPTTDTWSERASMLNKRTGLGLAAMKY